MPPKIAILDDDEEFGDWAKTLLENQGFQAVHYLTAGKFLDSLIHSKPDLILLDLQLPGLSGWDLVKAFKHDSNLKSIPIVIISGYYKDTPDFVRGLEIGADDYVTKPPDSNLLLARIQALLRRASVQSGKEPKEILAAGPIQMCLDERWVRVDGRDVQLNHQEFELLAYLMRNPGRVFSRNLILSEAWGKDPAVTTRTVDKHVESLRKKLGPFGESIQTVIKVGYFFKAASPSRA